MKLFTVGPVQMYPETLKIEGTQLPYFRTPEFGDCMKEIERWFLKSLNAPEDSVFIGLTSSGTGAMDATVSNLLSEDDKVLVINGGSFGSRFSKICDHYGLEHTDYVIPFRSSFSKEEFEEYSGKGFTALLVNACDTSTGQLYDLNYLGDFCRRNGMLFIVDAVSAYLADEVDMQKHNINAVFTASQKALALSPGVALVCLDRKASERLGKGKRAYYFDYQDYIENQKRGQPPFTSAVGTMLALHQRMKEVDSVGIRAMNMLHADRAAYFRNRLKELPLGLPDIPLSNSCSPVQFPKENATEVYEALKSKYELILTPSGGDWEKKQLRVGHLGNLTLSDYDDLIEKLKGELR